VAAGRADPAAIDEVGGQFAFSLMQLPDLFLNGAAGNQAIDGHRFLLADAVSPVRGLVLYCRVPPGVQVDDVISRGEVQAQSSGPQADQEKIALALLEGSYPGLAQPGRGGAIEGTGSSAGDGRAFPE
jgi:hypothetical protein